MRISILLCLVMALIANKATLVSAVSSIRAGDIKMTIVEQSYGSHFRIACTGLPCDKNEWVSNDSQWYSKQEKDIYLKQGVCENYIDWGAVRGSLSSVTITCRNKSKGWQELTGTIGINGF